MSRAMKYQQFDQTSYPTFAKTLEKTPVSTEVLLDILRRPRFSGSEGELYVVNTYLRVLPGAMFDGYGNILVTVGEEPPTTMFSSHTDTVHKAKATGTYKLAGKNGWLTVKGGGVLGADCGTGIWIMLNLIAAKVPGLYVFHRDEEIGGGGSSFIAKHHPGLMEGIKHCIAFDRKATSHVITHQGGSRCCSDAFAEAFAGQLNGLIPGAEFEGNDGGSFTDSANYTHLIPECTNLSVGYYDQHTQQECQDLPFATRLVNALIRVDYTALPAERDPNAVEEDDWNWYRNYRGDSATDTFSVNSLSRAGDPFMRMVDMISEYPSEIADMLEQLGYDADTLEAVLIDTYNV